jgi:alkylation response protein AidB-like acyl-CoA dehydrogenase
MSQLTDEQQMLKENAERFLEREAVPFIAKAEKGGEFPWQLLPKLAEFGYIGPMLPDEDGGQGASYTDMTILMEAAGYQWLGLRALMNVANMIAGLLNAHANEEQKQRYLKPLLAGQRRVFVAITEPNHGSDASSIETRAIDRGDHFELRGTKQWITNAEGDFGVVLAQVVSPDGAPKGPAAFIVDRSEAQYTVRPLETMILRGTGTSEIIFDGTKVPRSRLVGQIGGGLKTILTTLNEGRLSVSAGAVGAAQKALDLSIEYAKTRVQFGRPIGEFQLVQGMLTEMVTLVRASRLLCRDAAAALDAGRSARLECAIAKKFCTESAHRVASLALQVHGGSGYSTDLPLERIFRDTRGGLIPEGTSEIQILIIGRELLGLSAFGDRPKAKKDK